MLIRPKYKGIGARVINFEEYPTIVSIYKNSPSDKAGLRVGDRFVSITETKLPTGPLMK